MAQVHSSMDGSSRAGRRHTLQPGVRGAQRRVQCGKRRLGVTTLNPNSTVEVRMIARILVPLDGSPLAEQATSYAEALATGQSEIVLFRAVDEQETVRDSLGQVMESGDEGTRKYADAAHEDLSLVADRLRQAVSGLKVDITVAAGDPADQILRVASEIKADIIVMASHGRGALGRWTYGSVADRVSREATIPVMIVRPSDPDAAPPDVTIRRVIVTLDGSTFAERALPVAKELAQQIKVPIRLIRAIDPARDAALAVAPTSPVDADLYQQLRDAAEDEAKESLQRAANLVAKDGPETTWAVIEGPATGAILDTVEPGDLIVLASRGRSGIKRWVLGSVAEKLVRHAPVPVVLVPTREEVQQ